MQYMTLPFLLAIVVYHDLYNSTATNVQSTLHTAAVLKDNCYISLQQVKTYNQKDVLYFFLMFVNKPKYRTVVCTNKNIYLLLKIILSNQVEVNTGPSANTSSDSIKYPWYICSKGLFRGMNK